LCYRIGQVFARPFITTVRRWLQLHSTVIRLRFGCSWTAQRPFDYIHHDRAAALRHRLAWLCMASGLRHCDLNDLW